MGEDFCYLLTLLSNEAGGKCLLKCAIKTPCKLENFDMAEVAEMLPLHVRNCGPIVDMEPIFEVVVKT